MSASCPPLCWLPTGTFCSFTNASDTYSHFVIRLTLSLDIIIEKYHTSQADKFSRALNFCSRVCKPDIVCLNDMPSLTCDTRLLELPIAALVGLAKVDIVDWRGRRYFTKAAIKMSSRINLKQCISSLGMLLFQDAKTSIRRRTASAMIGGIAEVLSLIGSFEPTVENMKDYNESQFQA